MLPEAVDRLLALPDDARVLDVGGWAAPLNRADWVIDALPFATRGAMGFSYGGDVERFGEDTWVVRDVCDPEPWPFADGAFDVAVCVTTLEDLRDPVRVCREMARVARTAYLEVPTIVAELIWGIEGPWLGHSHHHWFCLVGEEAGTARAGAASAETGAGRAGAGAAAGGAGAVSGPTGSVAAAGSPGAVDGSTGTAELVGGEPAARDRPAPARIRFALKQHDLHADPRVRVTPSRAAELAPREHLQGLWWSGPIDAAERLLVGERLADELAAHVEARFPPRRVERLLRRGEAAAGRRFAAATRPVRDRLGAAARRARGSTTAVPELDLGPQHVRAGLGRPRDGGRGAAR